MKLSRFLPAIIATGLLSSAAFAQGVGGPGIAAGSNQITTAATTPTHNSDLVPFVAQGAPSVPTPYAFMGNIGGTLHLQTSVPVTAWTITPANTTNFLLLNPAGTLATGTLTLAANPSDTQEFCLMSTQIQTAMTVSANTGQTLVGTAVTALTAGGPPKCWRYFTLTSSWYALQ